MSLLDRDDRVERFARSWLRRRQKELGPTFLTEAISAATDEELMLAFACYITGDTEGLGEEIAEIVRAYWKPQALQHGERSADASHSN